MNTEDYRFMITLVLSVAGIQTTIMLAAIGFMYNVLNKRLESIEKRLDNLEASLKLLK